MSRERESSERLTKNRSFTERSKLSDRGLVDFRRVCDQMGILDRQTDTIRPVGSSLHEASKYTSIQPVMRRR